MSNFQVKWDDDYIKILSLLLSIKKVSIFLVSWLSSMPTKQLRVEAMIVTSVRVSRVQSPVDR